MGTWNYGIFDNDVAQDIKEEYIGLLKRGMNSTEATKMVVFRNQDIIDDVDEAPVFWLALADVQWEYGILENAVKNTALNYLNSDDFFEQCKCVNSKIATKRKEALLSLKEKLLSANPSPKKISIPKIYRCQWKLGDVYAYPLLSDYAKEKGHYGEYFVFYKIGETTCHPGHIIPVVWAKITEGGRLPTNVDEFNALKFIQTRTTLYEHRFFPFSGNRSREEQIAEKSKKQYYRDEYGHLPHHQMAIANTSKRIIPKNLIYLGNFKGVTPPAIDNPPTHEMHISLFVWKTLEKHLIDVYHYYNLRESQIYSKKHDLLSSDNHHG